MNRREFQEKYQLAELLSDQGAHSHVATGKSGLVVMVHLLDVGPEESRRSLAAAVESLRPEAREKVLSVLDVDGLTAVVTRFIMDFVSFPAWLESNGARLGPQPPEPGEFTRRFSAAPLSQGPAATSTTETPKVEGEFTRMFRAGRPDAIPDTPASTVGPASAAPPTVSQPAAADAAGATLRFERPPASEPAPPTERLADTPPPEEGEFTRMFRAASPRSDPAPADATSGQAPVEHSGTSQSTADTPGATLKFRAPTEPAPETTRQFAATSEDEAPAPPPDSTAGEFTGTFLASPPDAEPPRSESGPGPLAAPESVSDDNDVLGPTSVGATVQFRAPMGDVLEPTSQFEARSPTPEPAPEPPTAPREEGEFTRMFRAAHPDASLEATPSASTPTEGAAVSPSSIESSERSGAAAVPSPEPDVIAPEAPKGEGDFTRMFRAARLDTPSESIASPPSAQPPTPIAGDADLEVRAAVPPPREPPAEPLKEEGEFTRMFRAAKPDEPAARGGASVPVQPPVPPASPPRGQAGDPDQGAFTRQFRGPAPPPQTPYAAPGLTSSGAPPIGEQRPPARMDPPTSPAEGDFTRRFQTLSSGDSAPPLAPSGQSPQAPQQPWGQTDGYLDRLRSAGSSAMGPDAPIAPKQPEQTGSTSPRIELPPLPWSMAPAPPPVMKDEGAYTRMISSQRPPPEPSTPPPGVAATTTPPPAPAGLPPAKPPVRIGLIIGILCVITVALVLVIYLVLKSQMSAPAEGVAPDSVQAVNDTIAAAP